jgi:hypothetical protein
MEAVTNAFLGVAAIFAMLGAYLLIAMANRNNRQKETN